MVLDRETPMFADGSKVHAINHEGKYFKLPRPAERAALAARPRADLPGRRLAARPGFRRPLGRHDHHRRRQRRGHERLSRGCAPPGQGRRARPGPIKVLFLAYPLVDTTMEAARERQRLMARGRQPASRSGAVQHVAPDQHRFLEVRPRTSRYRSCPPTATNHRSPNGSARRRGKSPSANPPRPASISPARSTTSPA